MRARVWCWVVSLIKTSLAESGIKERDKVFLLDAPLSPPGFFGQHSKHRPLGLLPERSPKCQWAPHTTNNRRRVLFLKPPLSETRCSDGNLTRNLPRRRQIWGLSFFLGRPQIISLLPPLCSVFWGTAVSNETTAQCPPCPFVKLGE